MKKRNRLSFGHRIPGGWSIRVTMKMQNIWNVFMILWTVPYFSLWITLFSTGILPVRHIVSRYPI
jgi:hypothetical protein